MNEARLEAFMRAVILDIAERRSPEERNALADKLTEVSRSLDDASKALPYDTRGAVAGELRGIAGLLYRYPRLDP